MQHVCCGMWEGLGGRDEFGDTLSLVANHRLVASASQHSVISATQSTWDETGVVPDAAGRLACTVAQLERPVNAGVTLAATGGYGRSAALRWSGLGT